MARKWLLPSIVLTCSAICLIIAIVIPIIMIKLRDSEIKKNLILNKSNGKRTWGEIPGKLDVLMIQHYHMFNLTNPEEFMEGARPKVVEINGYKYREHDEFLDISYGDDVKYNLYRYAKRSSKIQWAKNISEDDLIMTVSIGAFGGWDLIKHFTRQQLSTIALSILADSLETVLPTLSYSIAMKVLLVNEKVANALIFAPAGITAQQGSNIWNDPVYGMGNVGGLQNWIRALDENLMKNQEFQLVRPYSSTLNILRKMFGLSQEQIVSLFSGQFLTTYQLVTLLFYNNFECEAWEERDFTCDPIFLAGIQWAYSGVTRFPPAIPPLGQSIVSINGTVTGYPEIFYFYESTGLNKKLPDYTFSSSTYKQLFYYNRTTGYPEYSKYTLLDVGKINTFFDLGSSSDFEGIADKFNITESDAEILWDYVNAVVDYTGLQGCYDPDIYNVDNRGISTEAALGQVLAPSLFNFTLFLANSLLINVTTIYDDLRFEELGLSCENFANAKVCENFDLEWKDGGLALWIQVHWNDVNSTYWNQFQEIADITYDYMTQIFDPQGPLMQNLSLFDVEVKNHYKCPNYGSICSEWFLANKQWAQSYVTLNLPGIFVRRAIENSTSVVNYPFFKSNYSGTPEYSAFALKRREVVITNDSLVNSLLSFTGLYSSLMVQRYFIQVFAKNDSAIQMIFGVKDPALMTAYLRYFTDRYFLGGLVKAKTVRDILFTDIDPLTVYQKNLNPLKGGNPAISLTMSQVSLNKTKSISVAPGSKFRHVINAGKHDISDLRSYKKIYGSDYVNIAQQFYGGQNKDGTQNLTWINFNPWNASIKSKGTDSWQFKPFLSSDDHLYYFLDIGSLIFKMNFHKHKTVKGYKCLQFIIDNDILKNQTTIPSQAKWFQNAPNGLSNETGVFIAPVFGSKPYFKSGDDVLLDMIDFQYPHFRKDWDICESFFDVEKHTGIVLKGNQLIQYNLEIKPDVLYPNLGKANLQQFGKKTYLPFVIYQRSVSLSQHKIDDKIGQIKLVPKVNLAVQIVGYTMFGILLLNGLFLVWRRRRASRVSRSENLLETKNSR
jgi:hypothetical protein